MLTMSNHSPHDVQFVDFHGLPMTRKIPDTEFDEYMRRLSCTCQDYVNFRTELVRRFPDREFVIVHFGDHQPEFTSRLLDRRTVLEGTPEQFPGEEHAIFSTSLPPTLSDASPGIWVAKPHEPLASVATKD